VRSRPCWWHFVLAAALVACGLWMFLRTEPGSRGYLAVHALFAAVFWCPAAGLAWVGLRRFFSGGVHVFSYRTDLRGRAEPDIWLRRAAPSRQAVTEFLEAYGAAREAWQSRMAAISAAQAAQGGSEAADLEKFADLRDGRILTAEEFERVKARIIGGDHTSIGFQT